MLKNPLFVGISLHDTCGQEKALFNHLQDIQGEYNDASIEDKIVLEEWQRLTLPSSAAHRIFVEGAGR